MSRFFLIRHGDCAGLGQRISGRTSGVHLTEKGRTQVTELADRLSAYKIDHLYSSPLERTRETAEIVGNRLRLSPKTRDGLLEIDFGEWSGMSFEQLKQSDGWEQFNTFRAGTRIPGGETVAEVQARMVSEILYLASRHPSSSVAVIGHSDPLKTLIAYFLGVPLSLMLGFSLNTASVSILEFDSTGSRLVCMNDISGILPV